MLDKLTSSQLAEWYAFDKLSPVGEQRADFRASYLAMTMTNLAISINGKKGSRLKEIKDFLLDWDSGKPKGTQSTDEIKRIFQAIGASNNKDNRSIDRKRKPKSLQK